MTPLFGKQFGETAGRTVGPGPEVPQPERGGD